MTSELITGNTYPVKDKIKAIGGRWNAAAQGWYVPSDRAEEARALVEAAGPPQLTPRAPRPAYPSRSRYRSNYVRFSSGAEQYRNKAGRCEDAPCCGCCS